MLSHVCCIFIGWTLGIACMWAGACAKDRYIKRLEDRIADLQLVRDHWLAKYTHLKTRFNNWRKQARRHGWR